MAEYNYTHEQVRLLVRIAQTDAWEVGYRDGLSPDSWSKQNPYKEVL